METLLYTSLVVLYICSFAAIIDVILHARTAQGAIAWLIALLTLPLFSLPIYVLFGRRTYKGYIKAHQNMADEIAHTRQMLTDLTLPQVYTLTPEEQHLQVLESFAPLPFTQNNHANLLIDGRLAFAEMLEAIDKAEHYIIIQFYIIRADNIGARFQRSLINKAKQGVRVYLLYDSVGSFDLDNTYMAAIKEAGAEVFEFNNTAQHSNRYQLNFRNHRKIVITDGRTAFIGGLNIGDEYMGAVPKFPVWRDTHIKLKGPCVQSIQLAFTEDWYSVSSSVPDVIWQAEPANDTQTNENILILPSGPVSTLEFGTFTYLHLINSAKKRIWIASPYFIPDVVMRSALQLAMLRGVKIKVLIPMIPDNMLNQLSTFAHVQRLINSGIEFYFYEPGFMHQKVVLVDESVSFLGTSNFANRSFRLNFEINALISGVSFAQEIQAMLTEDFRHSHRVTEKELDAMPLYFKILSPLARLLSPIL